MKPPVLAAVAVTTSIFLVAFFASNANLTGFLINVPESTDNAIIEPEPVEPEPLGLKVGTEWNGSTAVIKWTTLINAISTLEIGNERILFHSSTEFSREITGLESGTDHPYLVTACTNDRCEEKEGVLEAQQTGAAIPITGAIVGGEAGSDFFETFQASVSMVLYGLVAAIALGVSGIVAYERIASRESMGKMIGQVRKMIEAKQHEEASQVYVKAKQAFSELGEEAKLKHYNDLSDVYYSLKRHYEIMEAQKLAEKYAEGSISKEEFTKLSDLVIR